MSQANQISVIGRAERIAFPDYDINHVPAKIDTGADVSSVWATAISEGPAGLSFKLFGPSSKYYTGQKQTLKAGQYNVTRVSSSFGQKQIRYKVKLRVNIKGRVIRATFTLADRSNKTYPVLLGRSVLNGKFVVDVTQGKPLVKTEAQKAKKLQQDLKRLRKEQS